MKNWLISVSMLAALVATASAQACPAHSVALPIPVAAGAAKESKELLDTPFVKLASITLRGGTVLADHAAPVAVTIQALAGSGIVKYGDKQEKISAGAMVLLAPNTVHSVVPDGKADLVVLVHYLKMAGAAAHADHHAKDTQPAKPAAAPPAKK